MDSREQIADPVTSLVTGLPLDLAFRTKGQLAMDICADCYADGLTFDFICGDEVYGDVFMTVRRSNRFSRREGPVAAGTISL